MRKLLFIVFFTTKAFGDGYFTAKIPFVNSCNGPICQLINQPQVSLLIIEPVTEKLEFKSWTGLAPNFWANSDNGFLYKISEKVKLGGEVSYNHSFIPGYVSDYMAIRGVLEYKMW